MQSTRPRPKPVTITIRGPEGAVRVRLWETTVREVCERIRAGLPEDVVYEDVTRRER